MDFVRPVTIAAYRSGLQRLSYRHRRADALVYRALVDEARRRGATTPHREIAQLFQRSLGQGVDVGTNPWAEPRYDGKTALDLNQLLSLRFLEGFEGNKNPASDMRDRERREAVPGAVDPIGRDLISLLEAYGELWSSTELTGAISALIGFRLFQLPLRLAHAARTLLDGGEASDVTSGEAINPLEMYCDFTRRKRSPSDSLAQSSVERDLERLRRFFSDRLLLRSVQQAAGEWEEHEDVLDLDPPDQLRALAGLVEDRDVNAVMRRQLRSLRSDFEEATNQADGVHLVDQVKASGISPADQLKMVLVEGLRKNGLEKQVSWFWSTGGQSSGGQHRPYALLDGVRRTRSTWRYSPSEELVVVLVAMCFVEDSSPGSVRVLSRMPIAELLSRMERRFGILISRPPEDLQSADARAGSSENLEAFTRHLQLLGCFRGLSDDFSAQYVTPPRRVS